MRSFLIVFVIVASANISFGQLSSKTLKMQGKWKFKEGSGYEIWKETKSGNLVGYAFRVSKTGDTSIVERFAINQYFFYRSYTHHSYVNMDDSLVMIKRDFMSKGRHSMMFYNSSPEETPCSVLYKFGFMNKNKLKVFVRNKQDDEPTKFILYRIKEE